MPDITPQKDRSQAAHLPPPGGDSTKAEKYISQLIKLINQNKLLVDHTDLTQFDPSAIEDHYRMELKQYHVEISHSKQPETSQDFYIMLFTNLQDIRDGCSEKIILAYMHLTQSQFQKFKTTADEQVEKRRKEEEEKRFSEVMAPVDEVLEKIDSSQTLEKDLEPLMAAQPSQPSQSHIDVSQIPVAPKAPLTSEPVLPVSPQEAATSAVNTPNFMPQPDTSSMPQSGTNFSAPANSPDQKGVADLLNDYHEHYSAQPVDTPTSSAAPQPTFAPAYDSAPSSTAAPSPSSAFPSSAYPAPATTPSAQSTMPFSATPPSQSPQY